jgi:hypothetical protein
MNSIKALVFALTFCVVALTQAEGATGDRSKREALMMGLYPPDIIMRRQQALGITDDQRANILKAVQHFQAEVAEMQWTLQNDQQLLRESFAVYPIKTEDALVQAGQLLELESRFKLAHFRLLIAIKNELSEEQIKMIDEGIRRKREQISP